MRSFLSFMSALLASCLSPCAAKADDSALWDWENASCRWYFEGNPTSPPEVGHILQLTYKGSVKECSFVGTKVLAYFVTSETWRGLSGVCLYDISEVYRKSGGEEWGFDPPKDWIYPTLHQVFMSSVSGNCPRPDNSSYLPTDNVS